MGAGGMYRKLEKKILELEKLKCLSKFCWDWKMFWKNNKKGITDKFWGWNIF